MEKMKIGIDEKPQKWYQWIIYAIQHVLAMFVANSLIAILVFKDYGVNMVPAALVSAGIGTLVYLAITKLRSPVFLGSSAALMPVMSTCLAMGSITTGNWLALIVGLAVVGIVYVIVGLVIKKVGISWLNKLLPPIIVGPVIILIGLGLAGFATSWSMYNGGSTYNLYSLLVAIFTMICICLFSHYGKGTIQTIPFLLGILCGYALASGLTAIGNAIGNTEMQLIDFSIFNKDWLSWKSWVPDFAFLKIDSSQFNIADLPNILLVAIPVSFVAICEHIGDHLNLSNITGRNLLEDPGLGSTLMGDGIATAFGGLVGGMGNTTYGENVAVIGVTGVASSRVLIPSCLLAIAIAFVGPLMTAVQSIPYCVFGGAALILYGFIAISGVKALQKVDLRDNKNLLVASVILVSGIGGLVLNFNFGSTAFTFTSTALSMILGIILNLILHTKKSQIAE